MGSTEIDCFLSSTQDVLGGRLSAVTCGGCVFSGKWKEDMVSALLFGLLLGRCRVGLIGMAVVNDSSYKCYECR